MSPNLLFLLVVQAVLGRSLTAAVGNKLPEQAVSAKMTRLPAIHNNASSSLPPARMREDNIGAPVSCTLAWSLRMKTPALDIRTPTATAGFSGRGETAVNMSPNLLFLLVVQAVLGRSLTAAVGNKLPEQAVSAKMTRLPAIHNNASSSLPPARMREDNIGAPVSCTLAWSLRMKTPALDIRTPTATAGFSGRGETAVNMSPNLLFLLVVQTEYVNYRAEDGGVYKTRVRKTGWTPNGTATQDDHANHNHYQHYPEKQAWTMIHYAAEQSNILLSQDKRRAHNHIKKE
ncbi:hypothetical protein ISCGN_002907 [Ixodes scapularis]